MKKILYFILLLSSTVFSQTITVDDTRTADNLVNLLITDPCVETSSTVYSSGQSVAYFNQNGSAFPITEGVIIRNGIAANTQGTYTGTNLGTAATGGGSDAFLQNLSNTNSGSTGALVDLAFLEFEFTTYSDSFNFNFIFASNEYGEFQCLSRDIVAFELTNITTGVITNIALVPTTTNPVSTATIKDDTYNASCSSTNPTYFDVYNVTNPAASTLNMRGHSVSMSGSANIIPLNPYRLKLVIGDYISSNYDSAIFISPLNFTRSFSLGNDATICAGDSFQLDATIDNTYNYQWFLNGSQIAGETNPTYDVTQPGVYSVEVTKGGCVITDEIIFNSLMVNSPNDLPACDSGGATNIYNLTVNDEIVLGIDATVYDIFYFETPADITANNFIPVGNLTNYAGADGQTIYIKIFNTSTGNYCDAVYTFNLTEIANIIAGTTTPGSTCDQLTYDLSIHDVEVENGQTGTTITYYNSQSDAIAGSGSIGNIGTIPSGSTTFTFWFRIESTSNSNCFDTTSVVVTVHPLPIVDSIADVQECSQYQLQALTNGTYYLLSGGPTTPGQIQYNAGDIIDATGLYYIFVGPDANGCTNESDFELYFVDEYVPALDNCGFFTVVDPPYNIGAFYTAPGGIPANLIPTGTVFTNNTQASIIQTIYYYAEVPTGTPCRDERFDINIHPIPLVDDPIDEIRCNSYTLPALTNGMYYSGTGGTGTNYPVGHIITASETIYVYNTSPYIDVSGNAQVCPFENPFQVNIIDPNIFGDVFACETYTLPALTFGNYFDAPNGGGNPIDPSNAITNSQVVYFYANVTDASNCADFLNYNITIYPQVPVDTLDDGNYCGEYILPQFTPSNGNYYTLSGGPSISGQTQLNAGDIIDLTGGIPPGTFYIYNQVVHNNGNGTTTTCYSEDDFTVIISPFPDLYQYALSRPECDPYYLATPAVGAYYTEPDGPNGTGALVGPDVEHTTTETFYFFYEDSASGCRVDKKFERIFNGVNLPEINDIVACNSTKLDKDLLDHLPPEGAQSLYTIEYHLNDPSGDVIDPNTYVFNSTNTPTPQIVCLYAVNDDGFLINCPDEQYFTVSILETPVLPSYAALNNQNYCGSYTLPALPATPAVTTGTYTVNYYSQPGGNAADIINPANYTFTNSSSTPETHNVWVYAQTTIDGVLKCPDEKTFQFTIYPLLDLTITGGIICVNALTGVTEQPVLLNSGLDPVNFTVEWYLNSVLMGTGPTYLATEEGTYDVVIIKLTPDNPPNCNYKPTTVIVGKSSPAIATISVSEPFDNIATITINVDSGFGTYEFQLDGGNFQTSNEFYNVSSGFHTVIVRDVIGYCGDFILTASVIKYPKFFTPNFDGHNETWNITDLITDHPESIISIFDRYGKLIKQISPAGIGWDGTFNNQLLPSTDYWFTVNYTHEGQEKIFRAHFTLKR